MALFFFLNFWVDTNLNIKYVISLTLPHLDERHLLNHVPVKFESHLCRFPNFGLQTFFQVLHFRSNASRNYKQVFICDFHLKRTENSSVRCQDFSMNKRMQKIWWTAV